MFHSENPFGKDIMKLFFQTKTIPVPMSISAESIVMGVTLNLAHRKARILMITWLLLTLVPACFVVFVNSGRMFLSPTLFGSLFVVCIFSIGISIVFMCLHGVFRDLEKYPRPKGSRGCKEVILS